MGKPAARIGDMTAHGGAIVLGCPTVLIGGMPAARLTDMHVCPMLTPGVPPIPHVGGPIILGSAGVLIGGMPAARMGDMAMCVGPPDVIVLGCFTVLIGETMAGAAAAPGPVKVGLSSAAAAHMAAATALSDNKETSTKIEHWVEFEFVDKAGKPVSGVHYKFTDPSGKESKGVLRPDGRICRDALNAGQCKVQLFSVRNAKWSKDKANDSENVELSVDVEGFKDGTDAVFEIWQRDQNGPDRRVMTIDDLKVQGGIVKAQWRYIWVDDEETTYSPESQKSRYSYPEYYFDVIIGNCKARSNLLKYRDFVEVTLKDEDDNPIPNEEYVACLSNGEIRKGKLDQKGYAKISNVPPGPWKITLPNSNYIYEED